jgi:PAS domain S-box-containing protein
MAEATNQPDGELADELVNAPLDNEAARELLNHLSAGVIKVSREGHLIYINPRARRLLELNRIPITGSSLRVFEPYTIWPDGRPCVFEEFPLIRCLRTGERQTGDIIGIRLPSGRVLWLGVTAEPILDPRTGQAEAAVGTIIESPEPSHVEAALRHSEERYRRLIENAPDSIVVHQNGRMVFVNEAGIRLWAGRSREDFIGRNVLSFIHPKDRAEAAKRIEFAMSGNVTPLIVQRHRRLDGKSIYVEVTGSSCIYDGQPCVQVVFRDVTERRRTERLVRRQREILRVFFQRIPVIVGIFDAEGNTKAVNKEWRRVIGWGPEYSMAELAKLVYPEANDSQDALDYAREAAPGWRVFHSRVRDGGSRDLMWANIKLSSGDIIGMALDVTEQRAAEAALLIAKEQLEQRVRLRTDELSRKNRELRQRQRFLERTLAVQERDRKLVAYEIHDTILQEVIGALMYVDTLYDSDESDLKVRRQKLVQVRQLLRRCIEEARHMISGLRPPIIDEQGVAGAVDYLVSELNARGMNIRYQHQLAAGRLEADLEAAIFRIVQEALNNVERHSNSRRADVSIVQRGGRILVSVRDFGVGFDTSAVHEGHFGLEGICERAKLLGGEAKIDSRAGEGTEVRVELPLTLPRVAEEDSAE